jgi:hypothetical protein
MLDKMLTGRGYLGGLVEHSEGKNGESVVAIPRFLCGIPHLYRLRAEGLVPVVTPPTTTTRLGGVTMLQDNNKTKAIENMGINLKKPE